MKSDRLNKSKEMFMVFGKMFQQCGHIICHSRASVSVEFQQKFIE